MSLESPAAAPADRDLLRLYLHLRGTILGDFYFHIIGIERALLAIIKANLDDTFTYQYFRELIKTIDANPQAFEKLLSTFSQNFITNLWRTNELRNHVMHPYPPFSPTDEEFLFIRNLHSGLSRYGNQPPEEASTCL